MLTVTAWDEPIQDGDDTCPAGEVERRDLARRMAGALFVSLPLLFTMEMWQIARTIPDAVLLVLLGVGYGVNRLLLEYSGFRKRAWQRSKWWDALVAMGIGAVASVITLLITGIVDVGMDWLIAIKVIALETIPTGMGAAVAANQLGGGDASEEALGASPDVAVIVGSLVGGFLFAFNIAPTMETKVITLGQEWWMVGATAILSLLVSYLMVAIANFEQRDLSDRKIIDREWLEALVAYLIAVIISMLLLWVFGYSTPADPLEVWLPQTIALAYATTLGGAAGRLIL